MTLLSPGDQFPVLSLTPPGGEILALPGALAGGFGVVLFYRGSWCPYCNAQLRAFQRATAGLAEVGARVVALSVDDEATSRELIARHGLTFPVGHSADARVIAQATGAFLNEDPLYVQSTGFVLDPAGRGGGQCLLQRRHRPARPRRRRRLDPLPARARRIRDVGLRRRIGI